MILSAVRDTLAVSWNGDMLWVLPESERDVVEPLLDGDFVTNLREAGFSVMVDDRIVESRLTEHPGHASQKVHGRKGAGGGVTEMPRIQAKFKSGEHPAAAGGQAGNPPLLEAMANMPSDDANLDTMEKVLEANGYLTDNPAARAAAVAKVGDEIRDLDYERANLVFPNGAVYRGADGTADMSYVPAALQKFSSVDIHNHPSDSAHSPQDIDPFDNRVPKQEIRIATGTGDHVLRPGPAGWGDRETYQYTADRAYERLVNGGDLIRSPLDQSLRFWDDVAPSMGWTLSSPARSDSLGNLYSIFDDLAGTGINRMPTPTMGGDLP